MPIHNNVGRGLNGMSMGIHDPSSPSQLLVSRRSMKCNIDTASFSEKADGGVGLPCSRKSQSRSIMHKCKSKVIFISMM